jgi:alkanesulfonate monooxygenase SsuD/methylene tetrahydromethanopterin reductase-like flavin-dependent oxidoreductase (luciferase family)
MRGDFFFARDQLKSAVQTLRRLLAKKEPDADDDPYAYVTAPKKPRPPQRAAAVAGLPDH